WGGMSVQHAVTVSVRDSAALLDATAGAELGAPYTAPSPERPFLKEVGAKTGKLKIALMLSPLQGTPVDKECQQAALEAAKLCESLGHSVEEAAPKIDAATMGTAQLNVLTVSIAKLLEEAAKSFGRPVSENDVEPVTWIYYQMGLKVSGIQYAKAIATFQQL